MSHKHQSSRAETRWAVRIVPLFIAALVVLATYILVGRLSVEYFLRQKGQSGVATAFIVIYFFLFLLTWTAYLRTLTTVQFNPGVVPLSPNAKTEREATEKTQKRKQRSRGDGDVEDQPWVRPDSNPDSPGLEEFYSKDVFVCEVDGRPKWCSECRRWKPDRAHHSTDLGFCVRKMDHFCPWVGGMVSETAFNFFAQFCFYCTLYCAICLAGSAYSLQQRHSDNEPLDGWSVALVVVASVFGSFTGGMTLTSLKFILTNTTNIDMLKRTQTINLAVRIPLITPPTDKYQTIVYPLQPLPRPGVDGQQAELSNPMALRDQQAEHKFAILRTKPRENPWNLGLIENWKSVMGDNLVEWLLPIRHSPCCNHESMESDYRYGSLISELRQRYGIPSLDTTHNGPGIEMLERETRLS